MICGNCKEHHISVGEVRACYADRRESAVLSRPQNRSVLADPQPDLSLRAEPEAPISQTPTRRNVRAEDGIYRHNGEVYKVQTAVNASGLRYAKHLKVTKISEDEYSGEWERSPGMVFKLLPEEKLSIEEAAAFGKLYGICCICGTVLSNEKSIERGIGPVCLQKMGWDL